MIDRVDLRSPNWYQRGTRPMLLLQNGLVIDGSRIVEIGTQAIPSGCDIFDCSGLVVAPGFIDLHSHLDLQVLEDRMDKIRQGVTSEVVGNCGFSPFPFDGSSQGLQEFASGILGRTDGWGWRTATDYLQSVE